VGKFPPTFPSMRERELARDDTRNEQTRSCCLSNHGLLQEQGPPFRKTELNPIRFDSIRFDPITERVRCTRDRGEAQASTQANSNALNSGVPDSHECMHGDCRWNCQSKRTFTQEEQQIADKYYYIEGLYNSSSSMRMRMRISVDSESTELVSASLYDRFQTNKECQRIHARDTLEAPSPIRIPNTYPSPPLYSLRCVTAIGLPVVQNGQRRKHWHRLTDRLRVRTRILLCARYVPRKLQGQVQYSYSYPTI